MPVQSSSHNISAKLYEVVLRYGSMSPFAFFPSLLPCLSPTCHMMLILSKFVKSGGNVLFPWLMMFWAAVTIPTFTTFETPFVFGWPDSIVLVRLGSLPSEPYPGALWLHPKMVVSIPYHMAHVLKALALFHISNRNCQVINWWVMDGLIIWQWFLQYLSIYAAAVMFHCFSIFNTTGSQNNMGLIQDLVVSHLT